MVFIPTVLSEGDPEVDDRTLFWASDSQWPFPQRPDFAELQSRMQAIEQPSVRSARFPSSWYVRTADWKLVGWDTLPPLLFDARNDLSEANDLSAQHPEVVQSLSGEFAKWFSEQSEPLVYPMKNWRNFKAIR